MRLAYLAKAVSKRVVKLDCGEGVFEDDDMVQWEGGYTLCVEGRRRGREDSRVCPRCSPPHPSCPFIHHPPAVPPASGRRRNGPQARRSELCY